MHHKRIVALIKHSGLAEQLEHIFDDMDVEVHYVTIDALDIARETGLDGFDLVLVDAKRADFQAVAQLESILFDKGSIALLLILKPDDLEKFRPPVRIASDFICRDACAEEYKARLYNLLWPGENSGSNDFIRMGRMTVNLATYQVKIDDEPLDLTYLEYALLVFLVTQPGHTFSRDALLHHVWGFDYYGGSRTVDVHVRRLRAKLGPDYSHYLKTVRGVGYLWSM